MKKHFLILILFLLSGFFAKAQGDLRFFGTATKDAKPLSGATVTVLMDGKQIINLTTGKNGKFKFTIDLGHSYRINFSCPGCVDMHMTMDLHVPADKAWIYPDYVAEIPFFSANDPKVKTELFATKPFIKIVFDGSKGFYDDPKYRFIDEIFKNPAEEQRKKEELAKKEAEDKARREAEDRIQREEQERARIAAQEEAERIKREEAERNKKNANPGTNTASEEPEDVSMETDAIRLEREKQERLNREKQNKNIRAQYENNLLKLVAESERRNNLQKFNKMKEDAQGNSVVQVMRLEAELKAQNDFLIEQRKEKQKQTLANRQVKERQVKELVQTAALVERDYRVNHLQPVVAAVPLNYTPSPHVVVTIKDGLFSNIESTVISWPGGPRTIFHVKEYWWGSRYYYRDDVEIDAKTYDAEIYRHKRR